MTQSLGVMPMTRRIGELLDRQPVPEILPIAGHIVRPNRRSFYPPEVWAEMQRIYATPDPLERVDVEEGN